MFKEREGRLSQLAAQLANATQPGRFNRDSQYWQYRRRDLVVKDEERFADTDQQRASLGNYARFNSVNGWIVYECDSEQWWERLIVGRICKGVRRAGRTTVGVGSTAGVLTESPDTGNTEGTIQWRRMNRGSRTRISNVHRRESNRGSAAG